MDSSYKLNSGYNMPILGLGTFLSKKGEVKSAVISAIKNGYRHIDCAIAYDNEIEIGEALKECIPSLVKREELFITTKLWLYDYDDVESGLNVSLKRLGLDYVDLYLTHWPIKQILDAPKRDPNDYVNWFQGFNKIKQTITFSPDWFMETWRHMEHCVEKGLTKSIGVSNFSAKRIDQILSLCKIPPAVNQIELHPGLTQKESLDYCKSHNIQVTAYCPIGNPSISSSVENQIDVLNHPLIVGLAKKYNKTSAQISIRWIIDRGALVIPKSVHENRIIENSKVFDFKLTSEEIEEINKLNCEFRIGNGGMFLSDPEDVKKMWE